MELLSLRMYNYGPHADSIIDFSEFNIAAIIGRNGKDFRRSNSTGKSHIPKAISWVFFETVEEDNVSFLKWEEKKGFVKVKFKEGDQTYLVKRTLVKKGDRLFSKLILKQFKNGLWDDLTEDGIDGKKNTQKKLEDIIKADEEIFLHTCYIKQDEINALMKMKSQERREVFSRPEGLLMYQKGLKISRKRLNLKRNELQVISDKCRDAKSEFREKFSGNEDLTSLEEELKEKKNKKNDLNEQIINLEKERDKNSQSKAAKDKIRILQKAIDDAQSAVTEIETDNASILTGGKEAEDKIGEIDRKLRKYDLEELTANKIQLNTELNKVTDSVKTMKIDIDVKQKKLEKLKMTCLECGNKLSEDQFLEKKRELKAQIKALDKELEALYEDKNRLEGEKEELDQKIERQKRLSKEKVTLQDSLTKYNTVWNKLDQAKINLKKVKDDNQPKIQDLRKHVVDTEVTDEQIQELKDRYDKVGRKIGGLIERIRTIKDLESEKKDVLKNLKTLFKNKFRLITEYKVLSHTSEMMKNLPSTIVSEAVPEIEQYSNEILQRFEQSNLQLKIITIDKNENETFDFNIIKDGHPLKFKSLGGGDRLRVSFAFRIGNAIRISHVRGCNIKFLLIDEVDALDDAGVEEFTEMIGKLSKLFKHILVISHDDKVKQYFSNQIIVTKKGKDASVQLLRG